MVLLFMSWCYCGMSTQEPVLNMNTRLCMSRRAWPSAVAPPIGVVPDVVGRLLESVVDVLSLDSRVSVKFVLGLLHTRLCHPCRAPDGVLVVLPDVGCKAVHKNVHSK